MRSPIRYWEGAIATVTVKAVPTSKSNAFWKIIHAQTARMLSTCLLERRRDDIANNGAFVINRKRFCRLPTGTHCRCIIGGFRSCCLFGSPTNLGELVNLVCGNVRARCCLSAQSLVQIRSCSRPSHQRGLSLWRTVVRAVVHVIRQDAMATKEKE